MKVWRKLASAKWADAWEERLYFLGPERLAITFLPNGKSMRLEAFDVTAEEGKLLTKEFGGEVKTIKKDSWTKHTISNAEPVIVRDRIVVTHSTKDLKKLQKQYPDRKVLNIPGSIAFGTGEHATTATCLRMIVDFAKSQTKPWNHLDLGTGSGILAIASSKLGADKALAVDFDPNAVRTAEENCEVNDVQQIKCQRKDVLKWKIPGKWQLITANLFSEVLIQAAPSIEQALDAEGTLILSGILKSQEQETLGAFSNLGLKTAKVTRKGKWVTARLEP